MITTFKRHGPWALAWGLLTLAGALLLGRSEVAQQRETFETDARIAHRLLSQRVVQHEAVLSTLALLRTTDDKLRPEQRLPSVYPQILSVQRRDRDASWPDERLTLAEAESRRLGRAVLADLHLSKGRYQMVIGAEPASYALLIDVRSMVPWSEWPMAPDASVVRVTLTHAGQSLVLQPGRGIDHSTGGWNFSFRKLLAADSQPFDMMAERHMGWSELPWSQMLSWSLVVAVLLLAARALLRQRHDRHRAEELLRLGQVARLNTLGELAAGMAHELNQPLNAVLAHTQTASRLLGDDPLDVPSVQTAMKHALEQARRASEVIVRLRRAVERPDLSSQLQPVSLLEVAKQALYLLEPELNRRHVVPKVEAHGAPFLVLAEPVALEQIIHHLLMNALQALDKVPVPERHLTLALSVNTADALGRLTLQDSGPGIPSGVLPRIFEPFFTTREGGLGLGLSLCETLASSMGGSLIAYNRTPHGAEFCLNLPLAYATARAPGPASNSGHAPLVQTTPPAP